ncbi:hypothetical protein MNV49_002041 [Pseudohyphozyma bogoriensis]|nr:hypothetical protein MNV49_002041 [Pseudohyphozyma bogoriensis]
MPSLAFNWSNPGDAFSCSLRLASGQVVPEYGLVLSDNLADCYIDAPPAGGEAFELVFKRESAMPVKENEAYMCFVSVDHEPPQVKVYGIGPSVFRSSDELPWFLTGNFGLHSVMLRIHRAKMRRGLDWGNGNLLAQDLECVDDRPEAALSTFRFFYQSPEHLSRLGLKRIGSLDRPLQETQAHVSLDGVLASNDFLRMANRTLLSLLDPQQKIEFITQLQYTMENKTIRQEFEDCKDDLIASEKERLDQCQRNDEQARLASASASASTSASRSLVSSPVKDPDGYFGGRSPLPRAPLRRSVSPTKRARVELEEGEIREDASGSEKENYEYRGFAVAVTVNHERIHSFTHHRTQGGTISASATVAFGPESHTSVAWKDSREGYNCTVGQLWKNDYFVGTVKFAQGVDKAYPQVDCSSGPSPVRLRLTICNAGFEERTELVTFVLTLAAPVPILGSQIKFYGSQDTSAHMRSNSMPAPSSYLPPQQYPVQNFRQPQPQPSRLGGPGVNPRAINGLVSSQSRSKIEELSAGISALQESLDEATKNSKYFEATVDRLYRALPLPVLLNYLDERLKEVDLSPSMRLSIAIAKQEALQRQATADAQALAEEQRLLLTMIRPKSATA